MGLTESRSSRDGGTSEESLVYLKFSKKLNVGIVVEGDRTRTKNN